MKKTIAIITVFTLIMILHPTLMAQPLPYDTGIGGGEGTNPVGGGAPLDGGISMLMLLGAGYATRRLFRVKK